MRVLRVLTSIAFISGLLALSASAQRAASHGGGGFSGHASPAFHSSGGMAHSSFSPASHPGGGYPHPSGHGGDHGYGPNYHGPHGYGYSGYSAVGTIGWINPGYLSYGDSGPYADSDNSDQTYPNADDEIASAPYPYVDQPSPPDAQQQYAPYEGPVAPDPSQYQPPQQPVHHRVAAAPLPEEDAVTIIFKDGHTPLQVHNYMLTTKMLYVRDQAHRDIALNDIDILATQKANQNTDIDFKVPVTK